jgi:hypothetical protein
MLEKKEGDLEMGRTAYALRGVFEQLEEIQG